MDDPLQYKNKRVVISGCASGMGFAAAKMLLDLGAQVHGLDFKQSSLPLHAFTQIDLREPSSIENAGAQLTGKIDALFNCAGLGPTFSPLDIMKVNFIGTRALTEKVLPLLREGGAIGSIASTAGMGWMRRIPTTKELLATKTYDEAVRWCEANPDVVNEGYSFSKEAVIVWTMQQSQTLIKRGIRINCTMPALTDTPMYTDQIAVKSSKETLDDAVLPMGRPARPEEQALPLLMINSAALSFVNGAAWNVDGGRTARAMVGA